MQALLHFHFSLPASAAKSEGAESAQLLRRGLQPFLAWLEFVPEVKACVSFSGLFLEELPDSALRLLRQLVERNQLEILVSPMYDACLPLLALEEQNEHLERNRAFWADAGIGYGTGIFLEYGIPVDSLAQLGNNGVSYIIAPASRFKNGSFEPLAFTGSTTPLIILASSLEPFFLEQYTPGVKQPIRFPASPERGPLAALTFRITTDHVLPDRLNPFEMRNAYLELLKQFRGEGGKLTETGGSAIGPIPGGELLTAAKQFPDARALGEMLLIPDVAPMSQEQRLLSERREALRRALIPLPELIKTMPKEAANTERLRAARRFYLKTHHADFMLGTAKQFRSHKLRRAFADAVLCAQVELDTIVHPEVDPLHGWITYAVESGAGQHTPKVVVDSQLKTLFFEPTLAGALVEFDYKPRKVNLSNTSDLQCRNLSFIDGVLELSSAELKASSMQAVAERLVPQEGDRAEPLVTRHTPDLFGLRLIRTLTPKSLKTESSAAVSLVKHYAVKAGIGAYLNNATTGFSVEHWVEGTPPSGSNHYLVSQFCFSLPSGNAEGMSLRPLSIAGGTAEVALTLDELRFVENRDVPGGLYGTRLIDGINGFVMDLRSAKPLNGMAVFPLVADPELPPEDGCGGVCCLFFVELRRVTGDDKANTIFLSIM
ncbi:MAG: hypothetical protein U0136_04500 [Bdellovibrionota bacterium]